MGIIPGKPRRIRGVIVPRRRFTLWAAIYFVVFVALPILGIAALLDYLVFF